MKLVSKVFVLSALLALVTAPNVSALNWEVEMEDFAFVPSSLIINVGDTVEWRNRDFVGHSSTSNDGVWDSGILVRDQRWSFVFTQSGNFGYHCTPHPTMTGSIVVQGPTNTNDPIATPSQFGIAQNYPNPFNARTTIGFSLPRAGHATVEVFNLLGQRMETLLDGKLSAGSHDVIWDAGNIQSGVFFYRVAFDGVALTGRMTLLK
jgi:plastocyanin